MPKSLLEAIGSPDSVNVELQDGALILRPVSHLRAGWDDPARWGHVELTREDQEWLDADLTEGEDD
jgi:hypothetical protein